jgi:hypothetical protein
MMTQKPAVANFCADLGTGITGMIGEGGKGCAKGRCEVRASCAAGDVRMDGVVADRRVAF